MNAFLIAAAVAIVAAVVAYFSIKASISQAKHIKELEGKLEKAHTQLEHAKQIYTQSLEARRKLEQDIALLRSGTPSDKLAASVNVLQNVSRKTGTGSSSPDNLADSSASAGKHNP